MEKKHILAENMRRFKTKNLNEEVFSNKFYILHNISGAGSINDLQFHYKKPQSTMLNDPIDDFDSSDPIRASIVFELLGYNQRQKNGDYANTNLDDYVAAIDSWYSTLQKLETESGLFVRGAWDWKDDDDVEGDEWKRLQYSDDDDDYEYEDNEIFSETPSSTTITLRNGKIVHVQFIKGYSGTEDAEALFQCTVKQSTPAVYN
jgi:hypothetical protein